MLEVSIQKQLGTFMLDVEFSSGNGPLALLGASGCGKSVTLRCIAGILRPDSGRIVLNGRVLFDSKQHICLSPQQRRIGLLFQQYALFPHMTVAQNIAAGARHLPKAERQKAVTEQLKRFHLEDQADLRPGQISGGQQQRTALARILVGDPEALLLDEPFSSLDSSLRWELELELAERLKAFGNPVVYVSHDRDEVRQLCQEVCVLNSGRSEPIQTVKELFSSPRTLTACRLAGWRNILPVCRLDDHHVSFNGQVLTVTAAIPPACQALAVPPEALVLHSSPDENTIPCRPLSLSANTEELLLRPTAGGPTLVLPLPANFDFPAEVNLCLPADKLLPLL